MEPDEFANLVIETESAWKSLGTIFIGPTEEEKKSIQFRRSIYISENIKAGQILTKDNIKIIRPGYGLAPKYIDLILGKKINRNLEKGTALHWDMLLEGVDE
jgi:sialic acid synthase SpsE